jgi:hypothetical protein
VKTRTQNGHAKVLELPAPVGDRKPVALKPDRATMSVVQSDAAQVAEAPATLIAIGSFLEGRGLERSWSLRITGAELVPVK